MKKTAANIVLAAAAIIGISLIIYPHIAFALTQRNASYVTENYTQAAEALEEETIREELEKARLYNAQLSGESIKDPFLAGSGIVLPDDYTSTLTIDGIMGRVQIPKINVDLPIYHGTSDETLQKGTGHLEGTSLPIGGENTHAVITGHTGLNSAKMFTDLVDLKIGDEFYLQVINQVLAYSVVQIEIVEPEEVDSLRVVAGKDYATLITCTPYGVNSHRLLVRGERVPYTPQEIQQQISETKTILSRETLLLIISIAAVCILLAITVIANVHARRKKLKNIN